MFSNPFYLTAIIGGELTLRLVALNLVVAIATVFLVRWIIQRRRQKKNWPPL